MICAVQAASGACVEGGAVRGRCS